MNTLTKIDDIVLAIQTTQYILKRLNTRSKFIHTDEHNDLYIMADEDNRVYLRDLPVSVVPMLYKLLDYERIGLNPDDLSVLIERWKDV